MSDLISITGLDPLYVFLNTRIAGDLTVGVIVAIVVGWYLVSLLLGK